MVMFFFLSDRFVYLVYLVLWVPCSVSLKACSIFCNQLKGHLSLGGQLIGTIIKISGMRKTIHDLKIFSLHMDTHTFIPRSCTNLHAVVLGFVQPHAVVFWSAIPRNLKKVILAGLLCPCGHCHSQKEKNTALRPRTCGQRTAVPIQLSQ